MLTINPSSTKNNSIFLNEDNVKFYTNFDIEDFILFLTSNLKHSNTFLNATTAIKEYLKSTGFIFNLDKITLHDFITLEEAYNA